MAQHDYVIDNQSFPATRTDLNNLFQAIASTNSGASAPSTTYANQLWYDTTNNKIYIRNEDNDAWIQLFVLDQSGDVVSQIDATAVNVTGDLTIADAIVHSGDTDTKIRFPSNNTIAFEVAGGERGRFSSGGSFFVGTTSNPSTTSFGHKLTANGEFRHFKDSSATAEVGRSGGNAGLFLVRGDGDLENTNNRYSGISDQNLKENIVDASSQWDDIKAVRVRKYSLIEKGLDAPDSIGVIAQELEASDMGGLVKDVDEGYKTVAYSVLYMKAVKALQEAMERIEVLEARVTTLEG